MYNKMYRMTSLTKPQSIKIKNKMKQNNKLPDFIILKNDLFQLES